MLIPEAEEQRLDVWLYRARFFKTRTLAARMIESGKIRLTRNGYTERVIKSHTQVRAGYELSFIRGRELLHIQVLAMPNRRGPASEAASHYQIIE